MIDGDGLEGDDQRPHAPVTDPGAWPSIPEQRGRGAEAGTGYRPEVVWR